MGMPKIRSKPFSIGRTHFNDNASIFIVARLHLCLEKIVVTQCVKKILFCVDC